MFNTYTYYVYVNIYIYICLYTHHIVYDNQRKLGSNLPSYGQIEL